MPIFNGFKAAMYAAKYALSPNPSYPPFTNDCTSFVSQAMLAGGWTMIGGSVFDRDEDGVWWWGESMWSDASYTWGGAHNFSKFVAKSGRGSACNRDDLVLGDVVQIGKNGHIFHSMVVTSGICTAAGNVIRVSYHTKNTLDKDLAAVEAGYPAAGGFTFHYWKIAPTF